MERHNFFGHKYNELRDHSEEDSATAEEKCLGDDSETSWQPYQNSARPKSRAGVPIVAGYLTLALVIVIQAYMLMNRPQCIDPSQMLYTPAQDEIEYRVETFQRSFAEDQSKYQGWPTDERDRLWDELYKDGVAVHLTKEEAGEFAEVTEHVAVEGLEDRYLLGLAVSHDLHCLDVLRKSYFPERFDTFGLYHPNGTVSKMGWRHIDHCIDNLRQSIMCHGDLSVTRFKWLPEAYFMKPQLDSKHTCRNFERIQKWAADRSIAGQFLFNAHVESGKVVVYPDYHSD